jgi:hypothetical protein
MSKSAKILKSVVASSFLAGAVIAAGCDGMADDPAALESTTGALSAKCAPDVPSTTLAAPEGNRLAFDFDAIGVQIYTCTQTAPATFAWVFKAPAATLFNPGGQVAGTHFAGPSWQANDGSTVVGARVAGFTVDASAIPWLLLKAASNTGDGRMAKVTYIQRLDTAGGIAPSTGCDAEHAGAVSNVDYTATYFFYEEQHGNPNGPRCD